MRRVISLSVLIFIFLLNDCDNREKSSQDALKILKNTFGSEHDFIFRLAKRHDIANLQRESDIFSNWGTFDMNLRNEKNPDEIGLLFKKNAIANGWKYEKEGCNRHILSTIADLTGCMEFRYSFRSDPETVYTLQTVHDQELKVLKVFYRLDGN